MENNYEIILDDLKEKITELILLYERSKEKNIKLQNQIDQLNTEIKQKEEKIVELNKSTEHLAVANSFSSNETEGENEIARNKINQLVREIDNCIALLNR